MKKRTKKARNQPQRSPDISEDQAVVELPDRETMTLLPSNLGSLSGMGGLGGSLLGGDGTTTPTATAPPLPGLPAPSATLPADMSGATQTTPIAQSDSAT